jgi:ribonuclease R
VNNKKHNKYPEEYRLILELFESFPRKTFNHKQIAHQLPLDFKCSTNEIEKIFSILELEDIIENVSPGQYRYLPKFNLYTGKIEITQSGMAYVICDDLEQDIKVQPPLTGNAFNGDTVTVELLHQKGNKRAEGRVVQIVERAKTRFVGTVQKFKGSAFVVMDNPKVHVDFFVHKKHLKGAHDQDKVIIEMTEWPSGAKNPYAKVVDILGKSGEHNTEMHAIIAEFGFPQEFPSAAIKEAEGFPAKIPDKEIAKRKDFRKTLTFTIDPEDSKDFDDSLSFKKLDNGNFEVGIHIADVTYYVAVGSTLDEEAFSRGTSVYMVDRVIPMLPERLSNELCSLRPDEDSLTFAVVVEIDKEGKVHSKWIGKTIIHSQRRFSYDAAQERLESGNGDLAHELKTLNSIAHKLKASRFKNGAISFETEEVKFKLDENGKPILVYKKIRKDAHKLIEEFMLLANRLVAEYVSSELKNAYIPYRVHDAPSMEKLALLTQIASRFGFVIKTGSHRELAGSINQMTEASMGKPEANILNPLAIRSMEKAIYTTSKTHHFGLAFDHYCHFTSPIRRYPDLVTHRLLFQYLNHKPVDSKDEVEKICKHSSAMEQKAVEAERASIKYKQVEFMSERTGQTFEGIVTGLTDWGIFVEIKENKCEGMVRITDIKGDFYEYYEKDQVVVGRRTKKKIELGQTVMIMVKKTNLQKRNIDFAFTEF